MWPMPRAPISTTRKRVVGVTRQTVSGTPISSLSEPDAARRSRPTDGEHRASRSLVLVLPAEPVMPTTRQLGRAVDDARGRARPKAAWTSSTTTHGTPSTGRAASAATAPRVDAPRDEVVAVGVLADPGDEEAARAGLAGVGDDRAVDDDGRRVVAGAVRRRPPVRSRDLGAGTAAITRRSSRRCG